ncbi:dNA-binding helix-turn-helix protein [Coprococcus sp. CAG:782]|nr:dNA-binding helix-turn-helix protein [Coprococcus sp. CAG:782]
MKIIDSKALGEAIRKRRKELGYTQVYLSDFTGFSVSFISDLERGKATAEIGKTIDLINLLGLDLEVEKRGK